MNHLENNTESVNQNNSNTVITCRQNHAELSAHEIQFAFIYLQKVFEYVLGSSERIAQNVAQKKNLWMLCSLFLFTAFLFAVPYGYVLGQEHFWKIATLYLGSLGICFPSLHVFTEYLEFKLRLEQKLVFTLLITSVAGLFSFGFFPILWFIDFTTSTASDDLVENLSRAFLYVSLFLGIAQMVRCYRWIHRSVLFAAHHSAVALVWVALLMFITNRMAGVLKLW